MITKLIALTLEKETLDRLQKEPNMAAFVRTALVEYIKSHDNPFMGMTREQLYHEKAKLELRKKHAKEINELEEQWQKTQAQVLAQQKKQ